MSDLGHLVAAADSLKMIEHDWLWINLNLMPYLDNLDDPNERAVFASIPFFF